MISEVKASSSLALSFTAAGGTLLPGMTLTPGAGDYLILFSMDVEFIDPAGFEELEIFVKLNGVQHAQSNRFLDSENSLDGSQFAICTSLDTTVSLGAGETIEVWYLASDAAEFTGFNRSLTVIPVITPKFASGLSGTTTIAGGGQSNFGTVGNNVGAGGGGDYLLLFSTSIDGVADNIVELRVTVDGVIVPHTARRSSNEGSAPDTKMPLLIAARVSPLDNQIVRIVWERVAGGGLTTAYASRMILQKTKPSDLLEASSVADDTSIVSGVDELIDGMTISPLCPTEYLTIFSSYDFYGSIGVRCRTTYSIYEDGAAVADLDRTFEHEDSIDSTPIAIFAGGKVTTPPPPGDEDIEAYWRATTTELRTIHERTLVAFREPAPKQAITATAVGVAGMATVFGNLTLQALNAVAVAVPFLGIIPFIASVGGKILDVTDVDDITTIS